MILSKSDMAMKRTQVATGPGERHLTISQSNLKSFPVK